MEHRPERIQAEDKPILDANHVAKSGDPAQARVHDGSNELFGAPANARGSRQTDDEPPRSNEDKSSSSEEEKAAVRARSLIRQHLTAKVGLKPWTLPTPGPEVDPNGFSDPICDEFWKNVWIAAAVHNVGLFSHPSCCRLKTFSDRDISESIPRCSGRHCDNLEAVYGVCHAP